MVVAEMINTHDLVLTKKVIPGAEDLGERAGSIKSENYRPGSVGFKIDYNGDVEFNNGTFRGHIEAGSGTFSGALQAATGEFNGMLKIGGAWDNAGNINDINARGSILVIDRKLSGDNYELRTKNLVAYGETILGMPHGNTEGKVTFTGKRRIAGTGITALDIDRRVSGNYTAPDLYNLFNSIFSNEATNSNFVYPINGSFNYSNVLYNITSMDKMPNVYVIRGMNANGIRFAAGVYSNQIVLQNISNSSNIGTIPGYNTNTITVDFIFL